MDYIWNVEIEIVRCLLFHTLSEAIKSVSA